MDWCELSHIYTGVYSLIKSKNLATVDNVKADELELQAINRFKCLEKSFKGIVETGARKFDTVSSLNVNLSGTMRSTTRNELINDDVSDDEEIYLGNDSDLPERLDKLIDAYSTVLSKKANAD